MTDGPLCARNIIIAVAVILVICCVFYYGGDRKEGYTAHRPNTYDQLPIDNEGDPREVNPALDNYMQPREPQVMEPTQDAAMASDTEFSRSFFFGSDHDRYDHLFNNPDNVLNQRTRPVELAPNVDLPLGGGPEAYNAQRHEYRRLRSHLGYHRALRDLPAMDLFGSAVAGNLMFNSATGRPLQSMFNNPRDHETGILARLDNIKARRDFEHGDHTVPHTVPGSGVGELPIGAGMASFSPVTGTLQLHDEREVRIPQADYSPAEYSQSSAMAL